MPKAQPSQTLTKTMAQALNKTGAKSQAPTLVLDDFLPYRLAIAASTISEGLAEVYAKPFGVTIAEWRIIANLQHFGPLNAGCVAASSNLDKAKVTRALQRLQARRLIHRVTTKVDRRQIQVSLTPAGEQMFASIAARAQTWEAALVSVLTPAERTGLNTTLAKLTTRARDLHAKLD
jgi:DNA-binding MarR family transcriptional regulator